MSDAEKPQRIPFHPVPRDFPGFPMPTTVPPGLRIELSRAPIVDGEEGTFDEWMRMLTDRYDEAVDTLAGEKSVFEATFSHREADGTLWMYHLQLFGEGGGILDTSNPLDAAHAEYNDRAKTPGWEELEPRFMLTPTHLRDAMVRWGETGTAD